MLIVLFRYLLIFALKHPFGARLAATSIAGYEHVEFEERWSNVKYCSLTTPSDTSFFYPALSITATMEVPRLRPILSHPGSGRAEDWVEVWIKYIRLPFQGRYLGI